jgi:hypothetical protein
MRCGFYLPTRGPTATREDILALDAEGAGFRCLRKPFRMAELVAVSILLTGNEQTESTLRNGRFRDQADYGSP